METISELTTTTTTSNEADVRYVGMHIRADLMALSKAYPELVLPEKVNSLHGAWTVFIAGRAVTKLGFSIYDPADLTIYHELVYRVLDNGEVETHNPNGDQIGRGGMSISALELPHQSAFVPWVVWSQHMESLSQSSQKEIVFGTGWAIPSEGSKFQGKRISNISDDRGIYSAGRVGVKVEEYRYMRAIE